MKKEMTFKVGDKIRVDDGDITDTIVLCCVGYENGKSLVQSIALKSTKNDDCSFPTYWEDRFPVNDLERITSSELKLLLDYPRLLGIRKYYVLKNKKYIEIKL